MTHATFDFVIAADHPSLAGHFPGRPIVPGVLLIDYVFHNVRQLIGREIGNVSRVKFISPLMPGERAHATCEFDASRVTFRVATVRDAKSVALAEGVASFAQGLDE